MTEIEDAARRYLTVNKWVPIALGLDAEGRPKRPFFDGWQHLTLDDPRTRKQGWARAKGVGLLCGPNSGNLAVIDIDDEGLASDIFIKLARSHEPFRWVWTIRKRGHLYVQERKPSDGRFKTVRYQGREVKLELRCAGQQVAAPGTPGYILAAEHPPQVVDTVYGAYAALCLAMGMEEIDRGGGEAGYPPAWQEEVPEGDRNRAFYIEAHRLADSGMSFRQAVDILLIRYEQAYAKDSPMNKHEIVRTIESAFTRAGRRKAITQDPRFAGEWKE